MLWSDLNATLQTQHSDESYTFTLIWNKLITNAQHIAVMLSLELHLNSEQIPVKTFVRSPPIIEPKIGSIFRSLLTTKFPELPPIHLGEQRWRSGGTAAHVTKAILYWFSLWK